jgi:thiol:disulfide interchange protein DsbA
MKTFSRLRMLTLAAGLLLTAACTAQPGAAAASNGPAPYSEGSEYVTLPAPNQRLSSDGKVEVVEVFSYGCVHCAHFAPMADKLRKELPAGVTFKLLPAPFSEEWLPYARAYYAAKQLGVVERTHLALFDAKFKQNYPINSLEDLADFYARQGVDRAEFLRVANSDAATAAMKSDLDLIRHWQVDSTPTIVVDGKYRITGVKTQEEMAAVALWLAKRELAAKK